MSDGYIRVLPDSTGKYVDNSEITRDDATVVERQRVTLADPDVFNGRAKVTTDGELWVGGPALMDALNAILVELKVHTLYLQEIAGPRMKDDPETMRSEAAAQLYIN
jgi:hypothetical protein